MKKDLGVWVDEGAVLPRGYGVAWYAVYSCRAYCLPVPLHRLAGAVRALYLWVRGPGYDPMATATRVAFEKGRVTGLDEGYTRGIEHAAIFFKASRGAAE